MKKLCRIRLINWHYFVNETISVNGSCLITGENTAGKSTILDAIQLVLTTNQRKFNTAANEKSNRNLKGYVRCKTGIESQPYNRKGSIISYVALEFHDEKTDKYFILGVKIDSPDEDSSLTTKWFLEECSLEDLSFIVNDRPATNEEFRRNDRKVPLISQATEAKRRYARRLGDLEEKFFDMIPRSLAFKPMDNVKEFINRFILPERTIEVATLKNNISALRELEELMKLTKEKVDKLGIILKRVEEISDNQKEIQVNQILIAKAEIESAKQQLEMLEDTLKGDTIKLDALESKSKDLKEKYDQENQRLTNLKIALGQNETTLLITSTKNNIQSYRRDKVDAEKSQQNLLGMIQKFHTANIKLNELRDFILLKDDLLKLKSITAEESEKIAIINLLKKNLSERKEIYTAERYSKTSELQELKETNISLNEDITKLKNKKLIYPEMTTRLKEEIKKEFEKRNIQTEPYIFSDLLEVTDPKWQDAVEGYLHTQRFNIIVDPKYYDIALDVYNRVKKEIHTVGLVNTIEMTSPREVDAASLAYIVSGSNRWAAAYATYLLNRVIRCDEIQDLKKHKVAITADCMVYQNYTVKKIKPDIYRTPYIGAHALVVQMEQKLNQLRTVEDSMKEVQQRINVLQPLLDAISNCRIDVIKENLSAPIEVEKCEKKLEEEQRKLTEAENDPSYLDFKIMIDETENKARLIEIEKDTAIKETGKLMNKVAESQRRNKNMAHDLSELEKKFDSSCAEDVQTAERGISKFYEQGKDPATIVFNFTRQNVRLNTQGDKLKEYLVSDQMTYCKDYDCDFGNSYERLGEYIGEHHRLTASDIIKYADELETAKSNCQREFRESFLAKLKENIEDSKTEFRMLNRSLKGIYYGDDSYKFELTANKKKNRLYEMITSPEIETGYDLWSQNFDEDFKEELEDLFGKLTADDDRGEKVLSEYTDYRSYLDYDILIEKKDGEQQRFSKIYGEKSGGETQTPYYVAIAASFAQLYKFEDTIRIIMFDEAFDKMDDDRITSMMDFLNGLGFQIILATPPAKMEVIGEKVDTILIAIREGVTSIVEEYFL